MISIAAIQEQVGRAAGFITNGIDAISYPDLSPWATGVLGVIIWRVAKDLLGRPARARRRQTPSKQKKISRANHKRWQSEGRRALADLQRTPPGDQQSVIERLNTLNPFSFEYLITEGFRSQGAEIRKIRRVTGDGGIDGMVKIDGRWHLIQAKRYKAPVAASMIKEFMELCIHKKMPGIFVATSGFTRPARILGNKHARVTLMDGSELLNQLSRP